MYESLFGFLPTTCACDECKSYCRSISGMIVPADLDRWKREQGVHFMEWAFVHLAASPGAMILHQGRVVRIPTLVPRRLQGGRCHWLTHDEQCGIHATAPYGCRMFDHTMDKPSGDQRSIPALRSIMEAHATKGLYHHLWVWLEAAGKTVEGPEVARTKLQVGS